MIDYSAWHARYVLYWTHLQSFLRTFTTDQNSSQYLLKNILVAIFLFHNVDLLSSNHQYLQVFCESG
jgi:hypothetical protein